MRICEFENELELTCFWFGSLFTYRESLFMFCEMLYVLFSVQPSVDHSSSSGEEDQVKSSRNKDTSHSSKKSATTSAASNAKTTNSSDAPEKKDQKKDKGDKVSFVFV